MGENVAAIADAFGRNANDITALVLDRPRHLCGDDEVAPPTVTTPPITVPPVVTVPPTTVPTQPAAPACQAEE